jgi:hypothetical protein
MTKNKKIHLVTSDVIRERTVRLIHKHIEDNDVSSAIAVLRDITSTNDKVPYEAKCLILFSDVLQILIEEQDELMREPMEENDIVQLRKKYEQTINFLKNRIT